MSESNVEIARRGWEAALRGDLETIGELLHPDVKWHGGNPNAEGSCHNREQALRFMRHAWRPQGELVDIVGAGDKVAVITRSVEEPGQVRANLSTFRAGKVIEMVHYPNADDALSMLKDA
jgi:ketosteroid isomerase-like protein